MPMNLKSAKLDWLLMSAAVVLLNSTCGLENAAAASQRAAVPSMPSLTDMFTVAGPPGQAELDAGGSFSRHYPVMRKGRRLDSMILVAPLTVQASLQGVQGRATLKCLAAPVFNVGDGFLMEVLLFTEGAERLVFSRYFDAGRRAEDRDWIPLDIPLDLDPRRDTQLRIRVSAGPYGDLVDDWLALSDVRLMPWGQSR